MANILIVDASSHWCSVAVHTEHGDVALTEQQPRRHAQRLLPMVDDALQQANIARHQLQGVAYGCGPGSFTGIRIAAAVTQGIALALDLPVLAVSSLQAIAQQYFQQQDDAELCAVVTDAHMGEVFWGVYQLTSGLAVTLQADQVGSPEQCLRQLTDFNGAVVGDGLHLPALAGLYGIADIAIEAGAMLPIVCAAWQNGDFGELADHPPVYLRDGVAWKKLSEQPSLLKPI